jgi:hypothetical protein
MKVSNGLLRVLDNQSNCSKNQFFLIVLLCFGLVYFSWFPGVFTRDEEGILAQGMTGFFNDGHSPLLVRLWQLTGMIKIGPAIPYFIASASAIYFSARLFCQIFPSFLPASMALIFFVFLPPVFVSFGLVTKDLFFVASMLAVMQCATTCAKNTNGRQVIKLLVAMQVAVLIRIDAVFALLPFAIYFSNDWICPYIANRFAAKALAALMTVIMILLLLVDARTINRFVFSAKPYHAEQVSMLFDLAAISIQIDQMLIPSSRLGEDGFPLPLLRARFSPASADPIIWGPDKHHLVYTPNADQPELHRAWFNALTKYPVEYLRARAEYASRVLGIRNDVPWLMGQFQADESMVDRLPQQGWLRTKSPLQELYSQISLANWGHYIYLPWVWLFAGIVSWFLWDWKASNNVDSLASRLIPRLLAGSAISYTFLMCIVSAASLARYHAWPRIGFGFVIAITITSLLSKTDKYKPKKIMN